MGTIKRTPDQREYDRLRISEWMLEGVHPLRMQMQLNEHNPYTLTVGQVREDIQAVRKEWRAHRLGNVEETIAEELHWLALMETRLWNAWKKSITDQDERWTEIVDTLTPGDINRLTGQPGDPVVSGGRKASRMRRIITYGNPRYLELLIRVRERRMLLLGINPRETQGANVPAAQSGVSEQAIEAKYRVVTDEHWDSAKRLMVEAMATVRPQQPEDRRADDL